MIPVWFWVTGSATCALPLLAVAAYWAHRIVADVLDARRETPMIRLDDDTDVFERIRCTDLVPASVAEDTRALFEEPCAAWWLSAWKPPAELMQPAVIGDALTVLHRPGWQSPAWTVSREVTAR